MDSIWVSETVLRAYLFLSIKFTSLSINLSLAFSLVVFAWKTVFCLSCCCLQSITLPTQKKKTHAKKTPFYVSTLNSQLHMCRKAPKKTFHTPPYVSPSVCVCLCGRFRFHPPDINRIFPKGAKPRTHRCLRYSSTTAAYMCVRFCWDLWEGNRGGKFGKIMMAHVHWNKFLVLSSPGGGDGFALLLRELYFQIRFHLRFDGSVSLVCVCVLIRPLQVKRRKCKTEEAHKTTPEKAHNDMHVYGFTDFFGKIRKREKEFVLFCTHRSRKKEHIRASTYEKALEIMYMNKSYIK